MAFAYSFGNNRGGGLHWAGTMSSNKRHCSGNVSVIGLTIPSVFISFSGLVNCAWDWAADACTGGTGVCESVCGRPDSGWRRAHFSLECLG